MGALMSEKPGLFLRKTSLGKWLIIYALMCLIILWVYSAGSLLFESQNLASNKGYSWACVGFDRVPSECSAFESLSSSMIIQPVLMFIFGLFLISIKTGSAGNIFFSLFFWSILLAAISGAILFVLERMKRRYIKN